MKKILIISVLAACLVLGGCSSSETDKNQKNVEVTNNEVSDTDILGDEDDAESSSVPDKPTFSKIPDEAVGAFDYMINSTKKIFTQESKKRSYGYIGEEKIENKDCYAFEIYDLNDTESLKIATVAVTKEADKVYLYNENTEKYEIIEMPRDFTELESEDWVTSNSSAEVDSSSIADSNAEKVSDESADSVSSAI